MEQPLSFTGTVYSATEASLSAAPGAGPAVLPPLAGVTVFYDLNLNGVLDPGEPFAVTAANGQYTLLLNNYTKVFNSNDRYYLWVMPPAGFTAIGHNPPPYNIGVYQLGPIGAANVATGL